MFDSAVARFIVVPDVLLPCELPHDFHLLSREDVLVGNKVVATRAILSLSNTLACRFL